MTKGQTTILSKDSIEKFSLRVYPSSTRSDAITLYELTQEYKQGNEIVEVNRIVLFAGQIEALVKVVNKQ